MRSKLMLIAVLLCGGCGVLWKRPSTAYAPWGPAELSPVLSDAQVASIQGNQDLTFRTARGRTVVAARQASTRELAVVRAMATRGTGDWSSDAGGYPIARNARN